MTQRNPMPDATRARPSRACRLRSVAVIGTSTLAVSNAGVTTFTGGIIGPGALTLAGGGTVLLPTANALSGGLTLAVGETAAGTVLLASIAISGALVAAAFRLPILVLGLLAFVMGGAIGLDSPPEVVSFQEAIIMLIGTGLGASIGLGLVVEGAARMARDWQRIGVRVLGSWTAASALLAIAVRVASRS